MLLLRLVLGHDDLHRLFHHLHRRINHLVRLDDHLLLRGLLLVKLLLGSRLRLQCLLIDFKTLRLRDVGDLLRSLEAHLVSDRGLRGLDVLVALGDLLLKLLRELEGLTHRHCLGLLLDEFIVLELLHLQLLEL